MKTKKNYPYALLIILLLAAILRFGNYPLRLGFAQDSGRDALIAWQSIQSYRLPLLGPPSSSWGFNFGPAYYYLITFFTLIIPGIYSPWIGFTFLSLLSVFLAYKIGEYARGKKFGIILSLVTAVCFAEITNSTNLLNTFLVSFSVFLSFFAITVYAKTQKSQYLFLLGVGVAMAIQSHLQSLPLGVLLLSPLLVSNSPKIFEKSKAVLTAFLGFLFVMVPIIIFEIQHNLAWTKSLIDYATFGQYRFYTPVRWLTDITVFWPERFGQVLWGVPNLGIFISAVSFAVIAFGFFKKKIDRISLLVLTVFILEIFSIRNYKGPRSSEYLIFTHFFIIYIFSLASALLAETKKPFIYTLLLIFIFIIGLKSYLPYSKTKSNSPETIQLLSYVKTNIGKPVSFYVFPNSSDNAFTLYYLLLRSGLILESGKPVAICDSGDPTEGKPDRCPSAHRLFVAGRFVLLDYDPAFENFRSYPVQTINPRSLYLRTYNNYELIDY